MSKGRHEAPSAAQSRLRVGHQLGLTLMLSASDLAIYESYDSPQGAMVAGGMSAGIIAANFALVGSSTRNVPYRRARNIIMTATGLAAGVGSVLALAKTGQHVEAAEMVRSGAVMGIAGALGGLAMTRGNYYEETLPADAPQPVEPAEPQTYGRHTAPPEPTAEVTDVPVWPPYGYPVNGE